MQRKNAIFKPSIDIVAFSLLRASPTKPRSPSSTIAWMAVSFWSFSGSTTSTKTQQKKTQPKYRPTTNSSNFCHPALKPNSAKHTPSKLATWKQSKSSYVFSSTLRRHKYRSEEWTRGNSIGKLYYRNYRLEKKYTNWRTFMAGVTEGKSVLCACVKAAIRLSSRAITCVCVRTVRKLWGSKLPNAQSAGSILPNSSLLKLHHLKIEYKNSQQLIKLNLVVLTHLILDFFRNLHHSITFKT